jgi:hypothetical protein
MATTPDTSPESGSSHDRLIRDLAVDLAPVRLLPAPGVRALLWLAVVAAIAIALTVIADFAAAWHRVIAAPDLWLAVIGSTLTAVLAAIAAFELSLPDARRAWALLPLPAVLLWVGASGVGCLRAWVLPDTHIAALDETGECLLFIVGLSVPLSVLLLAMLRKACPLQPGLTAIVAGLASAAAAATLLNLFHPFDAAATDLTVHVLAVAVVVVVNRALGGRVLGTANYFPARVTRTPVGSK